MINDGNNLDFWQRVIEEHADSGLTIKEYCQLIEKTLFQFYYWKRRVNQASEIDSETTGFVEYFTIMIYRVAGRLGYLPT